MRGQKGITLVALIITIVVLLILATVAITSLQENNIIDNANMAVNAYNNKVQQSENQITTLNQTLQDYINGLNN